MKTRLARVPIIFVLCMSIMNVALSDYFLDQNFSGTILEFLEFENPDNEAEFQAMLYPFFLTG